MRLQHIVNTDLCPAGLEAEEIRTNFCPYYIAYLFFSFSPTGFKRYCITLGGRGNKAIASVLLLVVHHILWSCSRPEFVHTHLGNARLRKKKYIFKHFSLCCKFPK